MHSWKCLPVKNSIPGNGCLISGWFSLHIVSASFARISRRILSASISFVDRAWALAFSRRIPRSSAINAARPARWIAASADTFDAIVVICICGISSLYEEDSVYDAYPASKEAIVCVLEKCGGTLYAGSRLLPYATDGL